MANAPRRIPMHRPSNPGNRAARRAAGHPGTGGGSAPQGSGFVSPFQPPDGRADLAGDLTALNEGLWHPIMIQGDTWRAKPGQSARLRELTEALETEGALQIQNMLTYLGEHLHPDDLERLLYRLMDPDDAKVNMGYFNQLWRAVVTVGTARPFPQLSRLYVPLPTTGVPCGSSSLWQGYLRP